VSESLHPRIEWKDKVRGWSDGEALWSAYVAADPLVQGWLLELIVRRRGWELRNQKGAE